MWAFCPNQIAPAEADIMVAVERAAQSYLQSQQTALQFADLLAAIQELRNAVEALNDKLVELQGKMARIERRGADRRAGKMLEPWVPVVAV